MTQQVVFQRGGQLVKRELPDPAAYVWKEIAWGEHYCLFTPAYWVSQVWMHQPEEGSINPYYSQRSLPEEVVFCMLSGFGITAELAGAAFQACRQHGLIERRSRNPEDWADVLRMPLTLLGRHVHYRYPNQKAKFLADAMGLIDDGQLDSSCGRTLRNSLLRIKGCGPKTAGFIARNYLDADDVAILDIHVIRAGLLMGLFSQSDKVESDYADMERRYLEFCGALQVRPSLFDCVVWDQMRILGDCAIEAVNFKLGNKATNIAGTGRPRQLALAL